MGDGRRIGPYQPFAKLGEGPVTVVYKAYEAAAGRMVLLKVLRAEAARDASIVARFADEARLAVEIDHPNVVPVAAWSVDGPEPYLAAPFIDGADLGALVEPGPLPVDVAVAVAAAAARGLAAAHAVGILHRDLKPSNVLVANDGTVHLTDFGMASLVAPESETGPDENEEVRGTLAYLSPEQVLGTPATPASDVFALGATLYEMLTGTPAFQGSTPAQMFDRIVHHDPLPRLAADPAIPEPVLDLVRLMLAKALEERIGRAEEVAARLADLAASFDPVPTADRVAAWMQAPATYQPATFRMTDTEEAPSPLREVEGRAPAPARGDELRSRAPRRYRAGIGAVVLAGLLVGAAWWMQRGGADLELAERQAAEAPVEEGPKLTMPDAFTRDGETRASRVPASEENEQGGGEQSSEVDRAGPAASVDADSVGAAPERADTPAAKRTEAMSTSPLEDALPAAVDGTRQAEEGPAVGRLVVQGAPWAAVYIDGDSLGVTTLDTVLQAGSYRLTLRHPDFPPYEDVIDIRRDRPVRREISLWDLVAQVTFEVQPWADVYLDDQFLDTLPQDRPFVIAPGAHRVRLEHPSYGVWDTTLVAEPGTTVRYQVDLTVRGSGSRP